PTKVLLAPEPLPLPPLPLPRCCGVFPRAAPPSSPCVPRRPIRAAASRMVPEEYLAASIQNFPIRSTVVVPLRFLVGTARFEARCNIPKAATLYAQVATIIVLAHGCFA
ncbi:unnamed protein product, partial [Ectocarpus sp. 12 AP-2014]